MKRRWLIMVPLAISLSACGTQSGGGKTASIDNKINSGKELATLGDATVHEGFVELLQQVNPNLVGQVSKPAGKKRVVDNLLEQELLYKESVKRGIPKLPQYQEKAALYQRVIFAQAVVEEEATKKAKDYYDKNKDTEFSEVQVSQILVRIAPKLKEGEKMPPMPEGQQLLDEPAALAKIQEAKKKLADGAEWDVVVTEFSEDQMSKTRGGDMGKINRQDRRIERLEWKDLVDKAFSMKAGEVSDPIKAKDGYHIIKVTEVAKVAPYEEVQGRIKARVQGEVKKEMLESLTKGEKPKYVDEALKQVQEPELEMPNIPIQMGGPKGAMPPPPPAPKPMDATKPEAAPSAVPAAPTPAPTPESAPKK